MHQCTSQVIGKIARRPVAASSFIASKKLATEGQSSSNTQPLWCFQIIHVVRSTEDARPLRSGSGVVGLVRLHHSMKEVGLSGGLQVILSQ
jgi:hypothetical protein